MYQAASKNQCKCISDWRAVSTSTDFPTPSSHYLSFLIPAYHKYSIIMYDEYNVNVFIPWLHMPRYFFPVFCPVSDVFHTCPSRYPLLGGFLRARPLNPWRASSGGAGELEKTSPKARNKGGLSHGAGATGWAAGSFLNVGWSSWASETGNNLE